MSHSGDIPITIWWHKPLKTEWVVLVTFTYNLVTQALENEMSRSGEIPITIWWHKPLNTEWVVLVTFPLQSHDTSHLKRNESFWWHLHYNLVTQALKNKMSRSGDIPITIWWHKPFNTEWVVLVTFPLQSGDTSHLKRNESSWWHSHYNLVTQAIANKMSRCGATPILMWG